MRGQQVDRSGKPVQRPPTRKTRGKGRGQVMALLNLLHLEDMEKVFRCPHPEVKVSIDFKKSEMVKSFQTTSRRF